MRKFLGIALTISALLGVASASWAKSVCPFEGVIDFKQKKVSLNVSPSKSGVVSFELSQAAVDQYQLAVSLDHLDTSFINISSQINSLVSVLADKNSKSGSVWQGELASQYTLVNFKPVDEIRGSFKVANRKLQLNNLIIGSVKTNGSIELVSPFQLDLDLQFTGIKMEDFFKLWGADDSVRSNGSLEGILEITGDLEQPYLKGSFKTFEGFVKDLNYESIIINAEGYYPMVKLNNSKVSSVDGMMFNVEGTFNMARRGMYMEEIATLKKTPVVVENPEGTEWTLKSRNETNQLNTTEFKYFLRKENATTSQEQSDMLGVERNIRF